MILGRTTKFFIENFNPSLSLSLHSIDLENITEHLSLSDHMNYYFKKRNVASGFECSMSLVLGLHAPKKAKPRQCGEQRQVLTPLSKVIPILLM